MEKLFYIVPASSYMSVHQVGKKDKLIEISTWTYVQVLYPQEATSSLVLEA
jgi:hypothetical protein